MINIVYGLIDPRNDVVQYVGKSTIGNNRVIKHLEQKSHSNKINEWIKGLESKWLYPKAVILEEVENLEDLQDREIYWINYYNALNPKILNIQFKDNKWMNNRTIEEEENWEILVKIIPNIGGMLKKERLYRNKTQQQMADEIGMSRSTLSLCERDETVTLKTIRNYVIALKGHEILKKSVKLNGRVGLL